jgi:glycosyltransferase involved in cell wall biosynthesis
MDRRKMNGDRKLAPTLEPLAVNGGVPKQTNPSSSHLRVHDEFHANIRPIQYQDANLALLLRDSDIRRRMGNAGLARFEEHYTFEKFEKRLSDLLCRTYPEAEVSL